MPETQLKPEESEKMKVWTGHLARWRESGLSQKAYCAENALTQFAFTYWKKKLGAVGTPVVELARLPVKSTGDTPVVEMRLTREMDFSFSFRLPGSILRSFFG